MKSVNLDEEAAAEVAAAARWYDREAGLGFAFLSVLDEAIERISTLPGSLPIEPGHPPERAIRRCMLRRFPYRVVFIELEHEIRVLAVAHNRRRPNYWKGRSG